MSGDKTYNIENIGEAQFFYQSADYQKLTKDIADKREMIALLQEAGKTERALTVAAELAELEQQLTQLKEDVIRLYETFTKIKIDTERLVKAKAHFNQGEFREADAILNAAALAEDLAQLIERDATLDAQKAAVAKIRSQLSDEYLIKARLQATFYGQPNRFENACQYFDDALRAERTADVIFEYAQFLKEHNRLERAKLFYQEALCVCRELAKNKPKGFLSYILAKTLIVKILNGLANLQAIQNDLLAAEETFGETLFICRELAEENPTSFLPYLATALNNLALAQADQNNFTASKKTYIKALKIYEELDTEACLPHIAATLNNLANLQMAQNDLSAAQEAYTKALYIRRRLAKLNPKAFLSEVAMTLNNLANLQMAQNDLLGAENGYIEALNIRQELAEDNRRTFLPDVATTLSNLANLKKSINDFPAAQQAHDKALDIRRELAEKDSRAFLPDVAMTLVNLSIFYAEAVPDRAKSVALAEEVIDIAKSFPQVPIVQKYSEAAQQLLLFHSDPMPMHYIEGTDTGSQIAFARSLK